MEVTTAGGSKGAVVVVVVVETAARVEVVVAGLPAEPWRAV
jgi:hypothetical protein